MEDTTMITNKARTGLEPIDFNKVCNQVASDLLTKFPDTVMSAEVKHKVNHSILTLVANIKKKGPKTKQIDNSILETMVDYIAANLKCNKLIPPSFKPTIYKIERRKFTTILSINLKEV